MIDTYRLIAAERASYPVSLMCRVLGVNRTAFHAWERRPPCERELQDAWLTDKIKQIHARARGVYGARRVDAELRLGHGIRVGRKRIERLMREAGISGLVRRKRGRTTIRVPGVRVADDLVRRNFTPAAPDVLWVADVTYLRSWEGFLYLAAVQDAFSRAIVGWSMADHMRAELVRRASDGTGQTRARARPRASLRPGKPIRLAGVRPAGPRRRHRRLDGFAGRLLRQRGRRVVLRNAQEGARQPPLMAHPPRAGRGRVRIHRGVLQP